MKSRSILFFRVAVIFAAAAAVFALVCFARLTKTENDIDKLKETIADAENAKKIMCIKKESELSLGEIEQYAKDVLHMIPVSADNIRYIEMVD